MSQEFSVTISPGDIKGDICAIPSKSHLHRLLICAALADKKTLIRCAGTDADDIKATIDCLIALGAKIEQVGEGFEVVPLRRDKLPQKCVLPCMESGSTLRFMLPVVSALGVHGEFHMASRLPERPMAHLEQELERGGVRLWRPRVDILCCEGQLRAGEFFLPGNISSQYISGLLLALPLLGFNSSLRVTEPIESEGYIDMTLEALEVFGQKLGPGRTYYEVRGGEGFISPSCVLAEGDWSGAAFWLAAGAMPGGDVRLSALNRMSRQGDRKICDILEQMGVSVSWSGDILQVSENARCGVDIDAANIPDLVPAIAVVAAFSEGQTTIRNASRLRLKESDRLKSITETLNALGAKVTEEADGLKIQGVPWLTGGTVDSHGDHRIAMMAAIASVGCKAPVTIKGAQAVNKSYPTFWEELSRLGKRIEIEVQHG